MSQLRVGTASEKSARIGSKAYYDVSPSLDVILVVVVTNEKCFVFETQFSSNSNA